MIFQQARTRAALAALGIPLWASRDELSQPVPVVPLWGKYQEDLDSNIQDQKPQIEKVAIDATPASKQIVPDVQTFIKPVEHLVSQSSSSSSLSTPSIKSKVEVQQLEKSTRLPFTQTIATSEVIHVEQVIRFSLEARVIGEWVVLVSVQALNHPDRNALWKNISQALIFRQDSQEVCRFDWPLAEGARWQQNAGAQAALMGFLTRFGSERRIGLMGELPDSIIPERLERLPSLDELLREPLKKRSLWRLLIGNIR